MEFKKLTLADRPLYERLKDAAPDITGWEYSFDVLWVWDVRDSVEIYADGDMFLTKACNGRQCVFYPPLTADPKRDTQKALDLYEAYAAEHKIPFTVFGMNKALLQYVDPDKYAVTPDRDDFDYIYAADDLINLTGKKFHSKRNYITRFTSKYDYAFRPYTDADLKAVTELYDKWDVDTEHETLKMERRAIMRALEYHRELGLKIYLLFVSDAPVAFSVSALDKRGIVHNIFEKGDTAYEGVYQTINNLTAKACFSGYEIVNREEDMGIEGLRKAKLSYNPIYLYEKYLLERK